MNEEDKRECYCSYPKRQQHKTASGSREQNFFYTILSWPLPSAPRRSFIGYVCKENTFVSSSLLGIHVNIFALDSEGDERSLIFIFGIRIT